MKVGITSGFCRSGFPLRSILAVNLDVKKFSSATISFNFIVREDRDMARDIEYRSKRRAIVNAKVRSCGSFIIAGRVCVVIS